MAVMSGASVFSENSALHVRDASSGHRIVMDSAVAATVIGPGRTPEMSAGTVAAALMMGIRKNKDRNRVGSGNHVIPIDAVQHRFPRGLSLRRWTRGAVW